jgi:hypothetical protein
MRLKERHEYAWPEHKSAKAEAQHKFGAPHPLPPNSCMHINSIIGEVPGTGLQFNNKNREDDVCFRKQSPK